MDLFGLIVDYLYTYIFGPMQNIFGDWFTEYNPLDGYFVIFDGKINFYSHVAYVDGQHFSSVPILDPQGGIVAYVNGFSVIDILAFITTIVIFILLFIVAVKFIVWLFKQISFITRF